MTKQEVSALAQKYLEKQQHPEGITFSVLEEEVRRERYAWYVPVLPSRQPEKIFAYYEVLAEVETQLDEKEHLNVLFMPVVPNEVAMTV